jgi:UDPglucose 6-dehydrogenase
MIGSGYVGLVSAACFADFGHKVICIDKDEAKIDALKQGRIPIFEPGLDTLVRTNAGAGRLAFSAELDPHIAEAEVVFIAVGTPSRRGDGHADLTHIHAAAREIAGKLRDFTVIAIKSTVPVGTGDEVERIIAEANPQARFEVVSNPEFLREGAAISDFRRPDRIVVGTTGDPRAREIMAAVYRPLYLNKSPLVFTSRRASELIKYAANAFLAMKITFINEIADLCEKVGADVQDVAHGIGLDNRIGSKFLHPGPGYGGSCFPKDTVALMKTAQDHDSPLRLVETTVAINDQRRRAMARKVVRALNGNVQGKIVAILGLTFKPDTDDMREAPSLFIIQALQDAGARIRAYDPAGIETARTMLENVEFGNDPYETARGADVVVIVTEWAAFRALDLSQLKSVLKTPIMVDLRNIYSRAEADRHGFKYVSVGR